MFNVRIWGPYLVDIEGDGKSLVYMAMYDVNVRFSENLQIICVEKNYALQTKTAASTYSTYYLELQILQCWDSFCTLIRSDHATH
jgi:hypothetical protein